MSLFICGIALVAFTLTKVYMALAISRFVVGVCQIFICIYFPVWVDTFALESQKTVWLSTLLLAPPLGVMGGYGLTAVMIAHLNWRWTFYVQAVLAIPCILAFALSPIKYLDIDAAVTEQRRAQRKTRSQNI